MLELAGRSAEVPATIAEARARLAELDGLDSARRRELAERLAADAVR